MQQDLNVVLAQFKPIKTYKPRVGDFIVWHGWFSHYYAVVNSATDSEIVAIKAGLPLLLFTMDSASMPKNVIKIPVNDIKNSRGNSYSVLQGSVWYV